MTRTLRILLEGPNYAGKSSVSAHVRLLLPGSSIVELHDFCHQHIIRLAEGPSNLTSREDFAKLRPDTISKALEYSKYREKTVLDLLDAFSLDNIIVERLSLTQFVYFNLLFAADSLKDLKEADRQLAKRNVFLILLNADPDVLVARAQASARNRGAWSNFGVPYHLLENESIQRKGCLYDLAFGEMTHVRKTRIDTGAMDQTMVKLEVERAIRDLAQELQ